MQPYVSNGLRVVGRGAVVGAAVLATSGTASARLPRPNKGAETVEAKTFMNRIIQPQNHVKPVGKSKLGIGKPKFIVA